MAKAKNPNQFDDRREELVMETRTTWEKEVEVKESDRSLVAAQIHNDPKSASILEYVRTPTGLCRHITVTQDDVQRLTK